ncbi:MAG: alpha/beta hydrolase family protein, partial [Candidatus Limnocylindria bacterium]
MIHTPESDGPFPGVVFVHGAVDRDTWSPLEQYVDEQRRLAMAGYVVLVPDLRNHGESDDDPNYFTDLEMGTSADVVNAARALAALPDVDPDRTAVVGYSFGGVITFNTMVVAPDVAEAFVAAAPGSLSAWENFSRFIPADSPPYEAMTDLR